MPRPRGTRAPKPKLPAPVRARALPARAAAMVRPPRPRSAVANDRRSVPHPGVGGDAAADAGRSRAAQVSRVAGKYPSFEALAAARRGRRLGHLAAARLQHPAQAAALDRPRGGGQLRRRAARRSRDAAVVQGHRRVHRRRDPELRLPQAGGDPRHQRRPRALPRVRRPGRCQGPRDDPAAVGGVGGAGAAGPCLRLQPGADGLRRDGLHGAQAGVPGLPDGAVLPLVPVDRSARPSWPRQRSGSRRRRG